MTILSKAELDKARAKAKDSYALGASETCDLLETLDAYLAAAKAFRDLTVCYRLGKGPSERLFIRLKAARELLEAT